MPISFRPMREYMQEHGYTYYFLSNEGIDPQTLHRIRHDLPITTKTVGALCRIMDCQPGDLLEYLPEAGSARSE